MNDLQYKTLFKIDLLTEYGMFYVFFTLIDKQQVINVFLFMENQRSEYRFYYFWDVYQFGGNPKLNSN